MKLGKSIFVISAVLLMAYAQTACSAVVVTFDTPAAENSFQYAKIGQAGTTGEGPHNFIDWENGFVRLSSRYNQPVSRFLVVGGDANDGYFNNAQTTVKSEINFTYYNGNSYDNFVQVALNSENLSTVNNYPIYYARVAGNEFELYRHQGYDNYSVVDSYTLPSTLSGGQYVLSLTGVNVSGGTLDLVAEFYKDDALVASLNYEDANGFLNGYTGFGGGDAFNTGTIRGVEITQFEGGSPIPEPGALSLILLGAGAIFLRKSTVLLRKGIFCRD